MIGHGCRSLHGVADPLRRSVPAHRLFDTADAVARKLRQISVTRIWKAGRTEATACGTLFHAALDSFNRQSAGDPAVLELFTKSPDRDALGHGLLNLLYRQHVDRDVLFTRSAERQQAFIDALRTYLRELADIVIHARASGKPPEEILEELFGDRCRRVDVTFSVGPSAEPVHVTGVLDYVFYDWRTGRNRIIDYKLTPADKPSNDLFQVCIYALMHHVQHGTEPGVGVLYLHPARQMIEKTWEQVFAERHVVYNLLASMREWVAYDESTRSGTKPPGEPVYCDVCRWRDICESRLGPKYQGRRLTNWNSPDADNRLSERCDLALSAPDERSQRTEPAPLPESDR
jgi:hypothetical protein